MAEHWQIPLEYDTPDSAGASIYLDVDIPEGWYRVLSGAVKPGDHCLNRHLARDGIVSWVPVDESPLTVALTATLDTLSGVYQRVETYDCVIRIGAAVDKPCEQCGNAAAMTGYRFCWDCAAQIAHEIRERDRGF